MKIYILLILLIFLIGGCRSTRYPGWEFVRIEQRVPSDKCVYKIQEACYKAGAGCYNYYKQRATQFDANTVVLTNVDTGQSSSGGAFVSRNIGGASSKSNPAITALADYYYCPDVKRGLNKQ